MESLHSLTIASIDAMAGTRSGRSASRKSTPLSPPRQNITEPTRDTRRSRQPRAEDVRKSTEKALRGSSVESEASIVGRTTRKQGAAARPALSRWTTLQTCGQST